MSDTADMQEGFVTHRKQRIDQQTKNEVHLGLWNGPRTKTSHGE
jgi:hypothetical protein